MMQAVSNGPLQKLCISNFSSCSKMNVETSGCIAESKAYIRWQCSEYLGISVRVADLIEDTPLR